ncbi:unnamed protein product [Fusarium venenatum]|uniref:Uncharacterized protein n=1 Tax=Fusarium venenatum TaxID=56646 RepID=A0A2L2SYM6_9HYPO|nr:uncharacterized protein FVRRES_07590 [Fusarium venenatum]CEI63154.1 unnamed protein product [Fusarium venenatum]
MYFVRASYPSGYSDTKHSVTDVYLWIKNPSCSAMVTAPVMSPETSADTASSKAPGGETAMFLPHQELMYCPEQGVWRSSFGSIDKRQALSLVT